MSNIKKELIISAWNNLSNTSSSKFWGLISILSSLNSSEQLTSGKSYKINTIKLCKLLERLFYFGSYNKMYSDNGNYVIFSNIWQVKASEYFTYGKIPITDAAIYYHIGMEFEDTIDLNTIVNSFIKEIKLNNDDLNTLFDTNFQNITSLTEPVYSKKEIFKQISDLKNFNTLNYTLTFESPYTIVSHPAELSRAPFIQSLYAAQSNFECLLLTKFNFNKLYSTSSSTSGRQELLSFNKIIFGAPGTGKSHKVKEITQGHSKTVITFHPDTDYATFVGSYKPTIKEKSDNITYDFVPQAFANAYVNAWKNLDKPYFLVIEEINRGNCAQIFGDIFQLLDRSSNGFSDYVIDIDNDFANYIKKELGNQHYYSDKIIELSQCSELEIPFLYSKIALPSNLYLLATMNTSDQSLFPMDSAFKRRWDWECVPINYTKASEFYIVVGENKYNWGEFIKVINEKIKDVSSSEDKNLGQYFVKPINGIITFEQFRSKVMFYLWFEIFKDEMGSNECIFKYDVEGNTSFTFSDLFNYNAIEIIQGFMRFLRVNACN